MIRTFLALDFDERFLDTVAAAGETLRGHRALSGAKWVNRDILHATIRFFGATDPAIVPVIAARLPSIGGEEALPVHACGLGAFPNARHAKVLFAPIEGELDALASRAESLAVELGFAAETRTFTAHVTLARLKRPANVEPLLGATPLDVRGFVTAVTLYASETLPEGPRYTSLARVALPRG